MILNFPRAWTLSYRLNTSLPRCAEYDVCAVACSPLRGTQRGFGTGCFSLSAVLLAFFQLLELHFSCIESATGLHNETSGLPRLAGLQSSRKPLWNYPALLQDVECTTEGYLAVLPLKIDKCNPPTCLLAFPISYMWELHATVNINLKLFL